MCGFTRAIMELYWTIIFVNNSLLAVLLALSINLFDNFVISNSCILYILYSDIFSQYVKKCIRHQIFSMFAPCLSCYVYNYVKKSSK